MSESTGQSNVMANDADVPQGHPKAALVVILAMTFMEILDGSIVNVALPSMQQEPRVLRSKGSFPVGPVLFPSCLLMQKE